MTPQDRELIEGVAKVMGIQGEWERDEAFIQERYRFMVPYNNHGMLSATEYNPLLNATQREAVLFKIRAQVEFPYEGDEGVIAVPKKLGIWAFDNPEEFGRAVCRAAIAWGEG